MHFSVGSKCLNIDSGIYLAARRTGLEAGGFPLFSLTPHYFGAARQKPPVLARVLQNSCS
jgi:hypothetical protein